MLRPTLDHRARVTGVKAGPAREGCLSLPTSAADYLRIYGTQLGDGCKVQPPGMEVGLEPQEEAGREKRGNSLRWNGSLSPKDGLLSPEFRKMHKTTRLPTWAFIAGTC